MGDRANVKIIDGKEKVYFYAHWMGTDLFRATQKAIQIHERWDDYSYLNAIIFRHILKETDPDLTKTTGVGISTRICDNEHRILVLDVGDQVVYFETEQGDRVADGISFTQFADGLFPAGEDIE